MKFYRTKSIKELQSLGVLDEYKRDSRVSNSYPAIMEPRVTGLIRSTNSYQYYVSNYVSYPRWSVCYRERRL
jgi:hypothetical protein